MTEFFEYFAANVNLGDVGFAALLSLAIWSIITGRLVPRSVVDDLREDNAERLASAREQTEEWKQAYHLSTSATAELVRQSAKMLDSLEVHEHLLRSIQERGQQDT